MSKTMWICENCAEGPCVISANSRFIMQQKCIMNGTVFDDISVWKETTKYQITKVPEPVYYLGIQYPVDERYIEAAYLLKKAGINNNEVKTDFIPGMISNFIWVELGNGGRVSTPVKWLKQKQPEPTRGELQDRLNQIKEIIAQHSRGVDYAIRIIKIANGEK